MATISRGIALPGFGAPAVGFDTPFEMLEACHERVQRTLALQERLCEHLQAKGCDASAQNAAHDVLRYFDIAAPLHHEDAEEARHHGDEEPSCESPLHERVAESLEQFHDLQVLSA